MLFCSNTNLVVGLFIVLSVAFISHATFPAESLWLISPIVPNVGSAFI